MGTTGTSQPERAVCLPARDSSATVRACRRTDSGYTTEFGPDYGHVGRNGVSANKREGDLRTPRGVFPLRGGPAPMPTRAYNYAQVIGYNEGRTPGRGSAIFLHVDQGGGTAGCVSLPTQPLLAVLRWERAGAVIAIR